MEIRYTTEDVARAARALKSSNHDLADWDLDILYAVAELVLESLKLEVRE